MRTLDRTKPYGEVWGEAGGAKFEQDGILFDAHGRELKKPVHEVDEAPEAPTPEAPVPEAPTPDVTAQAQAPEPKPKAKPKAKAKAEAAPLPSDEAPVEAATDGQADAQLAAG